MSKWLKIDLYNVRKILSPSSSLKLLAKTNVKVQLTLIVSPLRAFQ